MLGCCSRSQGIFAGVLLFEEAESSSGSRRGRFHTAFLRASIIKMEVDCIWEKSDNGFKYVSTPD